MTKTKSRRVHDRHDCCFSISCAPFNSRQAIWGRMMNYSQSGLYFESSTALPLGMSVLIRVQTNLAANCDGQIKEGFRSLALGEVKWCEEFISEGAVYYGVGVKYYLPDY